MTIDWEEAKDSILQSVTINDIIDKYTNNKIVRNRCECFNCTGHQHNTMSLAKGFAYCNRCGKNFNQIQAVMEINHCQFKTACRTIISDFNLDIALDRPLTQSERKSALKRKLEREKAKQRKIAQETYCREINKQLIDKLRKCENYILANGKHEVEYYYTHDKVAQNIMICDKEQKRLDWLYCKINGLCRDEDCEYEYTMPTDSVEILRQLYVGKIKI